MTRDKNPQDFPTREELKKFIQDNPGPAHKRDIARHFRIKNEDRTKLRRILRELEDESSLKKTDGKSYAPPGELPESGLVEITGIDVDGEMRAKPVDWEGPGPAPNIYVLGEMRGAGGQKPGDRLVVKLKRVAPGEYEARVMKTIEEAAGGLVIGVFKPYKGGGYVYPTNKKVKQDYFIPAEFCQGIEDGELVAAEPLSPSQKYPKSKEAARIVKRLGKKDDPRLISLIAIHSNSIPTEFPAAVIKEADGMTEPDLSGGRVDIRHLPLVTIDGQDARDFDDAVFAEPDPDPKNPGGWHLIVAIADVSFYVRPGSALDKNAFERGNSTYFADRVVPMLPEQLSNELCSLKPKVNRACLAAHLWIDKDAKFIGHKFFRGLMRSAARLTYEQVEDAHKGYPDDTAGPLVDTVIKPLYKAYSLLKRAREVRGALEIDLPERKALINDKGVVTAIVPRARLESHQLIEEFMILANVAAAVALEEKKAPCIYRVHDAPAYDKLEATREFLKEAGYSLPKSDQLRPANINHILKLSAEREDKELIHTVLLRTQSQAVYSPDNNGHFGLALERYAHFTSPIRRYADLIVHRSLIRAYRLGEGGLTDHETENLHDIATHISATERRSMIAEREAMDRFTAQYLMTSIGKEFKGRISGVTRFGLFVTLDESGADGIVPIRSLPDDYYIHDEKRHALVGKNSGRTFRLAESLVVRLKEADPLKGSTVFELLDGARGGGGPSRPHRRKDPENPKRWKGSKNRGKKRRREK